jgi:hypothetical protein
MAKKRPQAKPAKDAIRRTAEACAKDLFINAMQRVARRLVLELGDGADGGGWCQSAVADVIERRMREGTRSERC